MYYVLTRSSKNLRFSQNFSILKKILGDQHVQITEVSDNRGADNRGRTVQPLSNSFSVSNSLTYFKVHADDLFIVMALFFGLFWPIFYGCSVFFL